MNERTTSLEFHFSQIRRNLDDLRKGQKRTLAYLAKFPSGFISWGTTATVAIFAAAIIVMFTAVLMYLSYLDPIRSS